MLFCLLLSPAAMADHSSNLFEGEFGSGDEIFPGLIVTPTDQQYFQRARSASVKNKWVKALVRINEPYTFIVHDSNEDGRYSLGGIDIEIIKEISRLLQAPYVVHLKNGETLGQNFNESGGATSRYA